MKLILFTLSLIAFTFCIGCIEVSEPPGKPIEDKELSNYRGVWLMQHGKTFGGKKENKERRTPAYIQPNKNGSITIGLMEMEKGKFKVKEMKGYITQVGDSRFMSIHHESKNHAGVYTAYYLYRVTLTNNTMKLYLPDNILIKEAIKKGQLTGNGNSPVPGVHTDQKFSAFLEKADLKKLFPDEYLQIERTSKDFRFPWTTGPEKK